MKLYQLYTKKVLPGISLKRRYVFANYCYSDSKDFDTRIINEETNL